MEYNELAQLIGYDIPCIEFYDEQGNLVFAATLDHYDLADIEVVVCKDFDNFGIVKLQKRDEKAQPNGTSL